MLFKLLVMMWGSAFILRKRSSDRLKWSHSVKFSDLTPQKQLMKPGDNHYPIYTQESVQHPGG